MTRSPQIPVIDLFAGPGGLGEGFSALRSRYRRHPFQIGLSIEKEPRAHTTLQLRSFIRQFGDALPSEYYDLLRDADRPLKQRLDRLYGIHPTQAAHAESEAWRAELGKQAHSEVNSRIDLVLNGHDHWVLLGGPPCQAYSIAGRSRNKGREGYIPHEDERQYLYIEYLHIIAEHQPAVFVMENVTGLLSATVQSHRIFDRILTDLVDPCVALSRHGRKIRPRRTRRPSPRYEVFSLVHQDAFDGNGLRDYVVKMEHHGIPQARHRLILLGVRTDLLGSSRPGVLPLCEAIPAKAVLQGLPRLRSGLSREEDGNDAWIACLRDAQSRRWFRSTARRAGAATQHELQKAIGSLCPPQKGRGGEFVCCDPKVEYKPDWFLDARLGGVLNHSTREHIIKDLHRYLYCACYGKANGRSPILAHLPRDLLPNHRNIDDAINHRSFADRFRVQLKDQPSTTITSHISKDGHYYIHYDATQCRSLTVREAARLQTFPDNYLFCGPRTSQYGQVGNAVPPLLARQIAAIVFRFLVDTGVTA